MRVQRRLAREPLEIQVVRVKEEGTGCPEYVSEPLSQEGADGLSTCCHAHPGPCLFLALPALLAVSPQPRPGTEWDPSPTAKPFACSVCPKRFQRSSDRRDHERVHTGERPYRCQVCSQHFTQSSVLTGHMRIHAGERPFACGICSQRFTQSSALSTHQRIHTGECPFRCPGCPKSFNNSSKYAKRRRLHSGKRPHRCALCGKGFQERQWVVWHLQARHPPLGWAPGGAHGRPLHLPVD
ncbi:zinc finger protein 787-like [Gopherus evgoodei]|uniref:zinc finger protein 787-like n=1 Tax=Gopherus evgoodei TaxID=1825980 RepID=UPI0011CF1DC4|nr:zinc finger protein 787-like [Gopherus evgoodei]